MHVLLRSYVKENKFASEVLVIHFLAQEAFVREVLYCRKDHLNTDFNTGQRYTVEQLT